MITSRYSIYLVTALAFVALVFFASNFSKLLTTSVPGTPSDPAQINANQITIRLTEDSAANLHQALSAAGKALL